ncbi:MAG TPA: single-stranded-DNA-specific exonuclease RecJ [Thermoanaerobaculia bacterium]|nr:single-stranded-DNA-specific exonuclease RecJ [Thermoanaerobaculia bacterium]
MPPVVAQLLLARGVAEGEEARRFLRPERDALHDPFLLAGAEAAADLLVSAARGGRRIVVFGDYDVDGVTAVAQLRAALLRVGADAVAFLPHRLRDGYGLKPETVAKVLDQMRPSVIVTVDCGITAVAGVALARSRGVDVIVTDHHIVPDELPDGAIVVNPRQPGCRYPDKELAACGIAMKIALAVARRAGVTLAEESLLRVACLGTIADLVPLIGENRVIAAAGLAALARPRAPGLRALLEECGIEAGRAPTSEDVAFRIAPRLNAAGRLDTAALALALFEERDATRARAIARELSVRNGERQSLERRVVAEARRRIEAGFDPDRDRVIIEGSAGWHRGVLGIAASRLAREYHRPVLLFALEGERASGSGRSVAGVPLHATLKGIEYFFREFGGHDQAVGGSLDAARWEEFRQTARAHFAASVPLERLERIEEAEAALALEEVNEEIVAHLEKLEPHGMGNPRPVLQAAVVAAGPFRQLGESGGRGRLRREGGDLDFVCWSRDLLHEVAPGRPVEAHYRLGRDRGGRIEAELVAARSLVPA